MADAVKVIVIFLNLRFPRALVHTKEISPTCKISTWASSYWKSTFMGRFRSFST